MNVYDFDKTIYDGDSSFDFYQYSLKKHPQIIKYWPSQTKAFFDYQRNKITKTEMKTIFYKYFQEIPNIQKHVRLFWDEYEYKIKDWYLNQKREDDLIISASPEFMLEEISRRLGFNLIASVVNPYTGENIRENCFGEEKVRRMREHYDLNEIENFYSDSYSDDPLAQFAKKSFLVKGEKLLPW